MEFSLLNLKDFGTLFPNKIINAVEYEGVINQYINDKLSVVKNIKDLSGNELIKKKKMYLNTYIIPLMNLLFSKYYIKYNNLNILINKNNSILHEFNNLKLFYAYNNPIINSVNVYFYKKYSGLNKNNGNKEKKEKKENKSLIDIDTLTIIQTNKTEIVTNLTEYIGNLTFENKKIEYKTNLKNTITNLTNQMNEAIRDLNNEDEYKNIKTKQLDELTLSNTLSANNYKKEIDDINKKIKEILNKVIYYHEKTSNVSKLISDINNILKYACSILIKTKIASSITITIKEKNNITPLNNIKDIYEKQIKLYKNYISSNKSNNNIKKITYDNLINNTKIYYDDIKTNYTKFQTNPTLPSFVIAPTATATATATTTATATAPASATATSSAPAPATAQNNLFIDELFSFINYDNILTNKFIRNNNTDNANIIAKLDEILPKLKGYRETLKLNLNSKNTKNTIINNDTLKKFFKNEKDLFQNFLTEIGASTASEKNKTNYEGLKTQYDIFDKITVGLDTIDGEIKYINNNYKKKLNIEYADVGDIIKDLNKTINEVNSTIKGSSITGSIIDPLSFNKIYSSPTSFDSKKFESSMSSIDNSIKSIRKAINDKKSADQSKIVKYANYWINTYSKIIIKEFPDNYENSSYTEIIPIFDQPIKINIKKCVNNLYDSFIKIDTKLINDINESTKKIQKNRLMFYLTQDDKFQKIKLDNMNSLNKLIPSYISSFKNQNKNTKQNLFINQIKNDNKSIGNNPDIQQFLSTIYTYNDTLIANLASKINNKLITNNNQLKFQIDNFKSQIKALSTKITGNPDKKNTPTITNNKTTTLNNKNKNLIYIPAYTDVIQLYFMNLVFIKLLYTNS